jgi:hypothetical protein
MVWVRMIRKLNSLFLIRDGTLEIGHVTNVLEASLQAVTQTGKISMFDRIAVISEIDYLLNVRDGIVEVGHVAEALEANFLEKA